MCRWNVCEDAAGLRAGYKLQLDANGGSRSSGFVTLPVSYTDFELEQKQQSFLSPLRRWLVDPNAIRQIDIGLSMNIQVNPDHCRGGLR